MTLSGENDDITPWGEAIVQVQPLLNSQPALLPLRFDFLQYVVPTFGGPGNPPMYKHELFGEDLINPYRGHLVTMVRHLSNLGWMWSLLAIHLQGVSNTCEAL